MISALLVLVTSIAYSASNLKQVEGTAFNLKQDYSIAVKDGRRLLTGVCSNGANRLDESPNGNIVVCQDASQSTCEEDFAVLCPTGFSLCDQSTFFANNIGWTGSASTNYLGEIRCRDGSGAGHDGIYSGQSLASPNWANRVWGSSLAECTAWYGCNEKGFAALCCGVGTVRIYEHFALGTCRDKDSAAHAFNLAHLEKALPQEDCEEECDSFDGCLGYSLGNTATSCLLHFADGDFPEQEGEDAGWSTRNSEVGAVEINDVWTAYTHYDCYILSDGSGFAFGCYDLTQLIFSPLLGYLADFVSLKKLLIVSICLNICGNVLYGMSVWFDHWWTICAGRLLGGAGSANIALCSVYLTNASDLEKRAEMLGRFRGLLLMARLTGPFFGLFMLFAPKPTPDSIIWIKLFNFYTCGGWMAVILSTISLLLVVFHLDNKVSKPIKDERQKDFSLWLITPHLLCLLFYGFIVWIFTSNMFAIATARFDLVHYQLEMGLPALPLGAGALIGFGIWWYLSIKLKFQNWTMIRMGFLVNALAIGIMNKFLDRLFSWQYFVGSSLTSIANNLFFPCLMTNFSKLLTITLGPNNIGFYTGMYSMFGSISRFIGPFIGSGLIYLTDTQGKPPCETEIEGKYLCCLESHGNKFNVDGCDLHNQSIYFLGVPATFILFFFVVFILYQCGVVENISSEKYEQLLADAEVGSIQSPGSVRSNDD